MAKRTNRILLRYFSLMSARMGFRCWHEGHQSAYITSTAGFFSNGAAGRRLTTQHAASANRKTMCRFDGRNKKPCRGLVCGGGGEFFGAGRFPKFDVGF